MSLSQIEETLLGMIEAEQKRQKPAPVPSRWRLALPRWRPTLPRRQTAKPIPSRAKAANLPALMRPAPAVAVKKRRSWRERRGDLIFATCGIVLAAACASFPWYIFYNQEQFGIRAMRFAGNRDQQEGPISMGSQGVRVGAPMSVEEIPPMQLDLFATATVSPHADDDKGALPEILDQPFPGDQVNFRLVYASSGRAMVADDTGLWVVERGSILPDNSRVKSIEQRDGAWVLVTSNDGVVPLQSN